eukprot:TRINITY_DN93562_c0_g1_i1.p1 TRINITY_DN93562_c0_g1~~TRINITY_DN93562_c0_g1_i1.p1  ORF type:complete len:489 (-),score=89.99 TRINITY_DN93562_c0_g1_i1:605-2071(-)
MVFEAMLTPRGEPKKAWFTPRGKEPTDGGSSLRRTGMGVLTPRAQASNQGAPASYKRCDPALNVGAAGKAGELLEKGGITSRRGLQEDVIVATPRSPDHMTDVQRRHRQKGGVGEISMHWGLRELQVPHAGQGYGVKSDKGEDVAQNFKSGLQFGVAEYMNERSEAVYRSTKREPLGKQYLRGHNLPPKLRGPEFPGFGKGSEKSDSTAKECIFPRHLPPETVEVKALYKRTHGNYDPGEGYNRVYDWPDAVTGNPSFSFGHTDTKAEPSGAGAKSALTQDCGETPLDGKRTVIVKDVVANYQKICHEPLGSSRRQMQGASRKYVPEGHTHGKPSASEPISAGAIVRGFYSVDEQLPDNDLGKCTIPGRRNYETEEPRGVPSVRYDIKAPPVEKRSVASSKNYGDDVGAAGLITPSRFQFQGVTPEDFQLRRKPEDLQSLLRGAGVVMEQHELQAILEDAASRHGDGDKRASLEAVMSAINDWTQTNA